jgi:hypothetical protein
MSDLSTTLLLIAIPAPLDASDPMSRAVHRHLANG